MSEAAAGTRDVVVIGAGIVGIACAIALRRDGHRVTVVDRLAPGEGCSAGNAGILAAGACVPHSMPGTLRRVPGWLFDPLAPLAIPWRHLPRLAPWLLRFIRAGTPQRVVAASKALRALLASSVAEHRALAAAAGAADLVRPSGLLYAYESAAGLAADAAAWELRRARGVRLERLEGGAVRDLEPALAAHFRHAVLLPDHGYVTDPLGLVQALARHFVSAGGSILRRQARDFEIGADGPRRLHTDGGDIELDTVVVAAGAWSGALAARLGSRVPLESERGYHVMIAKPGAAPRLPIMHGERMFGATPMAAGLRLAGTAEFGGLSAPPNYARARALLEHGRRMFPGLDAAAGTSEWMGHRPALPDSLPVIGRSPRFASVFFAFGHGHLGLTAAPITGRLIAELVAGRPPSLDLAPFAADRF